MTGGKDGFVFINLDNLTGPGGGLGAQLLSKRPGNGWEVRTEVRNVANHIWMSPGGRVWALGGRMRYFDDRQSKWIWVDFPYSSGINGPSDDNLLVCNPYEGRVYLWNGTDGTEIEDLHIPDAYYISTFYNGRAAVVLGWFDGWQTVVAVGK